jgi:hypothetical protein
LLFPIFQWAVAGVTCRHVALLHVAAGCCQPECIDHLIHSAGELNRSRQEPVLRIQEQIDLMKRTPLHYTVQHGNGQCVTALFEATAAEQRADQKARINFNIKVNANAEDAAVSFAFSEFFLSSLHSTAPRSVSRRRRNLRDAPSKGSKHTRVG